MDRPKTACRSCYWLVCSWREDAVRLGKAPLQSGINLIAAGSQPIVRRRAKIVQGAEMIPYSRSVVWGYEGILYDRTNHHHGL
ncbi:hypothetical protein [Polycladomyces subterraneus]|uniref:Uncharacterized protein n=1 Tax=Polycladomyces subterraneus TaxID=1016997 RepID=A0ABT8IMV9_9BACL|nr:hypothetical protein [Polycladomyces subterraneus]MDN4594138.1 hypothetical protein [Polycladomyces subterraneus]